MTKFFSLAIAALFVALPLFAQQADKVLPPVPPSGNVSLTLEEYNRLVELGNRQPKHIESAPIPYVLKRADLKLHATNDSVLGSIQLQGETFNKGETKVALTSGLTILDARQEGKPLPLELENGTQTAVLPGPSDFSVALEAGLPLSIETGRASFAFTVPEAGSAQLSLEVPGDRTTVHLSPGLITSHESQNGKTIIEATLVPGQPAYISWTTREVVAPVVPREVRFLSSTKTLVSVSEADIRLAVLADVTILQGQPAQFEMEIPAGYEFTGATGPTIESADPQDGALLLKVNAPTQKAQHFLVSFEKTSSATKADVPFVSLKNSQRDTGELLVEGVGTMELTATEGGSLKRMDFKETNAALRSLSRNTMQAAFRYHRQPNENPSLALEWTRFPDSSVLAAVAENAVVTTLVTNEGRSLTEVRLTVKNQAQPFLKVDLPAGASIVSAEVAGEKVKPVEGADGNRVPLLRPGFRPVGSYQVSYVFMHSGTPFAKKGGSEISLPKMDVPITVLQWEVFLPEQYKVKDFGGDAISANILPVNTIAGAQAYAFQAGAAIGAVGTAGLASPLALNLAPNQIGGYIVDPSGAVVVNTRITVKNLDTGVQRSTVTDDSGRWLIYGMNSGRVTITAAAPGFMTSQMQAVPYDANNPTTFNLSLRVASVAETVTVQSESAQLQSSREIERDLKKQKDTEANTPSSNVLNLQQRVSGVLPVRVDVPRAGTSYRFVRPLVLDEETKLTFTYKTKS